VLRQLINSQIWLSRIFDKLLPDRYTIDGNHDYKTSLVPKYLRKNLTIFDVGGGKNPYLNPEKKKQLNATVIGLDISAEELNQAPTGSYDETICADIMNFRGNNNADLVLCQALFEHLKDVEKAFKAISSLLKPGGSAIFFVPNRNSLYARLNIVLPQSVKKTFLYTIYPTTVRDQGFYAYYNKCTPSEFRELSKKYSLSILEERYYYISSYFSFFFPLYLVWRFWIVIFVSLRKEQAAETFSMVLQKEKSEA
jgi:2-polyprenyl-6-hydroxyphenyl methylase/3-demethylubiquinone-9 3-methyltransferase